MQETQNHQIRPASTRKFAKANQHAKKESCRQRTLFHQGRHPMMRDMRNFQLQWKLGYKFIDQVYSAQYNQKQSADFGHKMRCIENVQSLQNPQPDHDVHQKYARDIGTADLQDA